MFKNNPFSILLSCVREERQRQNIQSEFCIWGKAYNIFLLPLSYLSLTSCSPIHLEHSHANLFLCRLWKAPNIYFWSFLGPVMFWKETKEVPLLSEQSKKISNPINESRVFASKVHAQLMRAMLLYIFVCAKPGILAILYPQRTKGYILSLITHRGMELNLLKGFGGRPGRHSFSDGSGWWGYSCRRWKGDGKPSWW